MNAMLLHVARELCVEVLDVSQVSKVSKAGRHGHTSHYPLTAPQYRDADAPKPNTKARCTAMMKRPLTYLLTYLLTDLLTYLLTSYLLTY